MRQRKLLVITEVDGCLVDRDSFSHDAALGALERLQQAGVPTILCSNRTRAELERLQQELGLSGPFIVENGGALFVPLATFGSRLLGAVRRDPYDVVEFGKPRREVVDVLRRVAARENIAVSTFSDMSVQAVADESGLSLAEARLAKLRDYDEPFRVLSDDPEARGALCRALRAAGLRCSSGNHFDHVSSGANKGLAAVYLYRSYARAWGDLTAVGLGAGASDIEMLKAVDVPVVVRQDDGEAAARLAEQVRGARVTSEAGPAGWSDAVLAILDQCGLGVATAGQAPGVRRA